MNKKLLTLAVGAALVATTGIAAATEVDLHGNLSLAIGDTDAANTSAALKETGSANLSINLSEDLDNGMTAGAFMKVQMSTHGHVDSQLDKFKDGGVSLSGDFGTAYAGKMGNAHKGFTGGFDLFGDTVAAFNSQTAFLTRAGHSLIGYKNAVNGLSFAVETMLKDNDVGGAGGQSGSLVYTMDNLSIGFAGTSHKNDAASVTDATAKSQTALGIKWGMDNISVLGLYNKATDVTVAGEDVKSWTVGGTMGIGNGTAKVAYTKADSTTNANDSKHTSVGYGAPLSDNVGWGVNYRTGDTNGVSSNGWDAGIGVNF